MDLRGYFELYKGLRWSDFESFKYVGLLGAERGVPENTVFFIQKFTKMKPLHDPADHRPAHIGFHFSQAHQQQHMSEMALRQPGRFKVIADNLHVKQVYVGEGAGRRRYVIAYNPQQAEADRITREQNLDRLRCELEVINSKKRKKGSTG